MAYRCITRLAPALTTLAGALIVLTTALEAQPKARTTYKDLVALFEEWRAFEEAPRAKGGEPDYSPSTNTSRLVALGRLQARLAAMDVSGWPINDQVDHHLVLVHHRKGLCIPSRSADESVEWRPRRP